MMRSFICFVFFIIYIITQIFGATVANGFYCNSEPMIYNICRKSPDLNCAECETSSSCQCDNIQIYNEGSLKGGSNCQSEAGGRNFCYVSSTSPCEDKVLSGLAATYKGELWFKNDISYSYDACSPDNIQNNITGSESVLYDVKITADILKESNGHNDVQTEPFMFYYDDHNECKEECKERCDKCGAWSYDKLEGICYIHSVNACCAQKTKQIDDYNFVSGYRCPRCSSTKDKCPCSLAELVKGSAGCASTAFANDGKPDYTNPTALLRVDEINTNKDLCACEWRKMKRGCKCIKPICYHRVDNPTGSCKNPTRCRTTIPKSRKPECNT